MMLERSRISRRQFVKGLGVVGLGAGPILSGCAALGQGGSAGEVAIAGVNPLSGMYAQTGQDAVNGMQVAIDEAGGTVIGRKIKFLSLDTQSNVDRAVRLVTEQMAAGVKIFACETSSSVALAISAEVNRNGGLYLTSVGADEVTGSECKKSTFRWSLPTYGAIRQSVLPLLKAEPNLKKWYSITPNYVFGESLLKNTQQVLKENGGELLGNEMHSLQETEFSSYISKALAAKPDVLLFLNFADQSAKALRQAVSFGAKEKTKIMIAWWDGLAAAIGLGSELIDGVYFGCNYWHTIDSPLNKRFVELFQKKHNIVPNYPNAVGYISTKLIIDAMKKANSVEPKDLIAVLEGYEYDGITGKERIRKEDHQTVKNYFLLKGKPKDKMKDQWDYVDVISFGSSLPPIEESACKL